MNKWTAGGNYVVLRRSFESIIGSSYFPRNIDPTKKFTYLCLQKWISTDHNSVLRSWRSRLSRPDPVGKVISIVLLSIFMAIVMVIFIRCLSSYITIYVKIICICSETSIGFIHGGIFLKWVKNPFWRKNTSHSQFFCLSRLEAPHK